jgi:hypothetical protein
MNRSTSEETMYCQQSLLPDHDTRGVTVSSGEGSKDGESGSRRDLESSRDSTPKQIRWVGRVLAILVILCLILAAWVWTGILHGLP